MTLTVVILTQDEELHIARAIASVHEIATQILVVDSGSTDNTVEIAEAAGATVVYNPWTNHATQMNWGIDHVPSETEWILRLDADEIMSPELVAEINENLPNQGAEVNGIYVSRRIRFMGGDIRRGGLFPVRVLRLIRKGKGYCENRWMDEHLIAEGTTVDFQGELVDDNRKSLSWWIEKHNNYASREVVDILNLEYGFMPSETIASLSGGRQSGVKRWLKEKMYQRMPAGMRAGAYFLYRFIFRLGVFDTREGRRFHILQGFWYRYLVDSKLCEVQSYMKQKDADVVTAIHNVLGIIITPHDTP